MVFGQKVIPDHTFETSPKADILLVPGGGVFDNIRNEKFMGWVKAKAKDVDHVMSVCTGAFILQAAGLLAGQTVTATYGMIEDLSAPDTKVVYDRRFVDNGKIITTAGLSSGIDGAFHLVSKISGLGAAQAAALSMEYPWEPEGGWARAALADRFLPDGMAYGKAKVQGLDAKLISTEGDTDKWEFKMLVSAPGTPDAVADVLRDRIASSTGAHGMFRPISHLKGAPKLSAKSGTTIKWTFTDDQGGRWAGTGTVEPDQNQKSIVTLRLART
jgi:putative intracellular protease/amidase